jgi:ribonuclease E
MPNSDRQGGVSRRIVDGEDRKRLKAIIDSLQVPPGSSVIVRTAGSGRSKSEIKKDYDYLVRLWNSICEHTLSAQAPAFIHAEGDLLKRTIRDSYDNTIDEILVQGEKAYRTAKDFMKMLIPTHVHKVKQFKGKVPIFIRYNVEEKLAALHNPVVILASGSYIVINHTEALISIDVNSGRSTSERNIEETATKTNLEAAHEIAKQLRLRDLSGLIVIDFIDMMEIRNRRIVEKTFRDLLQKNDRAKVQVGSISNFGLLEMSRQRIKPSFAELNTIACPNCKGKGTVRTPKANAMMILRTVESEVYKGNFSGTINVYTNIEVVGYLLNYCRHDIENLEQRYNITLLFYSDSYTISDSFSIEKAKVNSVAKVVNVPITSDTSYHIEDEDNIVEKKPYTRAKTISYNDEKIEKEHSDIPKNVIAKKEDEVQPIQEGNTPRRGSRYKKQGRFARNKYESRENKPKDQRLDERKSRRRPEQYVSKQSAAEKGGKEPTNSKPSSNILKDLWNKILSG